MDCRPLWQEGTSSSHVLLRGIQIKVKTGQTWTHTAPECWTVSSATVHDHTFSADPQASVLPNSISPQEGFEMDAPDPQGG